MYGCIVASSTEEPDRGDEVIKIFDYLVEDYTEEK
jgi:hypothetical protein